MPIPSRAGRVAARLGTGMTASRQGRANAAATEQPPIFSMEDGQCQAPPRRHRPLGGPAVSRCSRQTA